MKTDNFDKQPLIKDFAYKTLEKVGVLRIVDKFNNPKDTNFQELDIHLAVGLQHNNRAKSGFGANHIYYKHFKDIPTSFHILDKDGNVDCLETIIHFLKEFLNTNNSITDIMIFHEFDDRPLILKSSLGLLSIDLDRKHKNFYTVLTFGKMQPKGKKVGYLYVDK